MIRIHYECDETNQKMNIDIDMGDENATSADVTITFEPFAKDDLRDPFGIMSSIIKAVSGDPKEFE